MGHLSAAGSWFGEFFPFSGWSEPAEIEKAATVQGRVGNPHDSSQTDQRLFIDFVSAHQVRVVTEIPQEPAEFPKSFRGAVETTGEGTALMSSRFEDSEPQTVEWTLRMPSIEGSINANQENALQDVLGVVTLSMQTWDMAPHELLSCCLA
jgi:hypothetical protein